MACNRDTVSQRTVRAVMRHFIKMQWRHPMAIQSNFNMFVMHKGIRLQLQDSGDSFTEKTEHYEGSQESLQD